MELIKWFPLVLIVSSRVAAASDCGKLTNTSMSSGTITSPLDTSNKSCQWNIELPPQYTLLQIQFHDLNLRNCSNCSCDYIEVWSSQTKDPEHFVGKYCGDLKDKYINTNQSNHLLVEFGSSAWSGMNSNHTFLSYRGFEAPNTTPPPTDCGKITNTSMDYGTITSPVNTSNKKCQWHIQVSSRMTEISLRFHDLMLRDCPNCSCDYIEVWSSQTKDPEHWVGKYCGDFKYKYIYANGSNALVEFGSSSRSGMKSNHTFLSYQGHLIIICIFPTRHFGIHTGKTDRPHFGIGSGSGVLAVTAIGIVLSILLFIGALACGMYVFRRTVSRGGRRVRRRRRSRIQQQQPVDVNLPQLPKLPNYFDTDNNSVLPPYLGFAGKVNKAVVEDSEAPPPYDEPPPYSLTEAAETVGVESTVQKVTAENNA